MKQIKRYKTNLAEARRFDRLNDAYWLDKDTIEYIIRICNKSLFGDTTFFTNKNKAKAGIASNYIERYHFVGIFTTCIGVSYCY